MDLDGAPMLGTPKQNSFIIKLGLALGFTTIREAVNTGLGRLKDTPIQNPFTMNDASTVITALLEKCRAAGVSTFHGTGKGKGKRKGGKGRGIPTPTPQPGLPLPAPGPGPAPAPPHPATPPDITRAGYTVEQLAEELIRRNSDEAQRTKMLAALPTVWLCGELERRGLPAAYLMTNPDAVAVAAHALDWIDWNLPDIQRDTSRMEGEQLLRDAGREVAKK